MEASITSYLQNHTLPPLCCVAIACQHLLTQNGKERFLKLCLEQSPLPPVQESLPTDKKIKECTEERNLGTRNAAPLEPMKLSDAWSTMKCGISEEVRLLLMELEAGAGVMFPVLGASSFKNNFFYQTLDLEFSAMLSGNETALPVRDFSISLSFCRIFWLSLCIL